MDRRLQQLQQWLQHSTGDAYQSIQPASSDASFRRYFRVHWQHGGSSILMDSPPDKGALAPFIAIGDHLRQWHLNTPHIEQYDLSLGAALLTDLGDLNYQTASRQSENIESLYQDALQVVHKLQQIPIDSYPLPHYDRSRLITELQLFDQWFLKLYQAVSLTHVEQQALNQVYQQLCDQALHQPQVWVHRDLHSRNLMVTKDNNPGLLDFQDAVIGPVTYDLVSLFKDCYIHWHKPQRYHWLARSWQQSPWANQVSLDEFIRWFDWMGVQRHLKVLGLFVRLQLRDQKSYYLQNLPLVMDYVLETVAQYSELAVLGELIERYRLDQAAYEAQQRLLCEP